MLWHKDQGPAASGADHPQPAENVANGFWLLHMAASTYRRMLSINLLAAHRTPNRNPNTATMHPIRSSSERGIPPTVRTRRWRSHPIPRPSGKLGAIAHALGVSEDTAKKRLYGEHAVNLQVAAIVAVLLRRGEVEDATAFEAPISAAMIGPITEPILELQRSADESDGFEDCAQAAWVHEKSDEALSLYVRKLASDLYHGSRLLAVLKAEQAKRADA